MMLKRKFCTYNLRSKKALQQISQLERMSCLEKLFDFLTIIDISALCRSKHLFHQRFFVSNAKRNTWELTQIYNHPNVNLDWILSAQCTPQRTTQEIPLLLSLKNITKFKTTGVEFAELSKQTTFPDTLTTLTLNRFSKFENIEFLPNHLTTLVIKANIDRLFPRFILKHGAFPSTLTELTFRCHQHLPIGVFPSRLITLKIMNCELTELVYGLIPTSVKYLHLFTNLTCELKRNALPPNLRILHLCAKKDSTFERDLVFPSSLTILKLPKGFCSQRFVKQLPPNLKCLQYSGGETFFSCLQNRSLPVSLRTLICTPKKDFDMCAPFPHDMLCHLQGVKILNMVHYNSDILLANLEQNNKLKHLSLTLFKSLDCGQMQKLQSLVLYLNPGINVAGLELLLTLQTLIIFQGYSLPIKLPVSLQRLELTLASECHVFQDLSSMTAMKDLKISHRGCNLQISHAQFPPNLQSLQLFASQILRSNDCIRFPSTLRTLNLQCDFPRKQMLVFPEHLQKLGLTCIIPNVLFLPLNLQMLCVPRQLRDIFRKKYPGVKIQCYWRFRFFDEV